MQNEITKRQPLLDSNGNPFKPGWCRRNLIDYNIEQSSVSIMRLKEWDFYQICNGNIMVQINFFNISMASCVTFACVDLKSGEAIDGMSVEPITPYKHRLSKNGDQPNRTYYRRGKTMIDFDVNDSCHHLKYKGRAKGKAVSADFICRRLPHHESITIVTPFEKAGHFFYTNKINCLETSGALRIGDRVIEFSPENTYTVLDWGRGIWPYSNMWYWANGCTRLDNGKLFGFELTWGFGDTSSATETALFYDGICHKISDVTLENDPEDNDSWMKPWHFISSDGRLDLTMSPFYDNQLSIMPLNLVGMRSHQVHGLFNGTVVLDDGTRLEIKDMYAFCEKVYNKW